jgi:oligoribonuclease (3'-5' exoribonuclease)
MCRRSEVKFLSLDLETTGLDPKTSSILEIGAVIGDTSDPYEKISFWPKMTLARIEDSDEPGKSVFTGTPFALALNAGLLRRIAQAPSLRQEPESYWVPEFFSKVADWSGIRWLSSPWTFGEVLSDFLDTYLPNETGIQVVGCNVGSFDLQFLARESSSETVLSRLHHRTIELGSLAKGFLRTDGRAISSSEMNRQFLGKDQVAHTALEDAKDAAEIFWLIENGHNSPIRN